jgi:hypothetical protein
MLFWSLLAWLPIAVWAWHVGRAFPPLATEPLLSHFGTHARFLVAVPLFILAEGLAHGLLTNLLPHFVRSGVVREQEIPRFRAALADIATLPDGSLPWIAILGIVFAVATISGVMHNAHEIEWPVADTTALYAAVKSMGTVPLGKASVAPLVLAAAVPMIGVFAIRVPVSDILRKLLMALL